LDWLKKLDKTQNLKIKNQNHNAKPKTINTFNLLVIVLIFSFYVLSSASFSAPVSITRIEAKRDRGFDYLDIYTTGYTEARGLMLEDKLYIDFPGARVGKKLEVSRKRSKRVVDISAVQKDKNTARVIITLRKNVEYDIANIFGRDKTVIELGDQTTNIYASQFSWEEKEAKRKTARPIKPVHFAPKPSSGRQVTLAGKKIILDPGHGGEDPGAFSTDGIPEKNLTLDLARKVAQKLQEEGATVVMTRNEDRRSGLKEVAEFANRSGADIFISIHYNSTYSSGISGTETYYYNPISRAFAERMHEDIVRGIRRKDHGLHRTPFYVVKNTRMPAVLLEPIYLSNAEESYLAKTASFQDELSDDIVRGVKSYFRTKSD
jgi:N-acetylmuramoyl-L-alanine amidase